MRTLLRVFSVVAIPAGFVLTDAAETAPLTERAGSQTSEVQRLITIDSQATDPFQVNPGELAAAIQDRNKVAAEEWAGIQRQIADFVSKYPDTPAGTEATEVIDQADLQAVPGHGLCPKGTIVISGIPILR